MRISSKLMLFLLCTANMEHHCFAGGKSSKASKEEEDNATKQDVASDLAALAVGAAALYAGYKYFTSGDEAPADNAPESSAIPPSQPIETLTRPTVSRTIQVIDPEPVIKTQAAGNNGCHVPSTSSASTYNLPITPSRPIEQLTYTSASTPVALAPVSSSLKVPEGACRISKDVPLDDYPYIKLSDKQLNSLSEQFDNKLMTPSSWGPSKKVTFDYQHILGSMLERKKSFHMGHTDTNNILYNSPVLNISDFKRGPCGAYGFKWDLIDRLNNGKGFNTFFPDDWSNDKIMSKIIEAIKHPVTKADRQAKAITFIGRTSEGLPIKIIFLTNKKGQPTGKVKSAYPRLK